MAKPINKELLIKYVKNECDPEELEQVSTYISEPEFVLLLGEILESDWNDFNPQTQDDSKLAGKLLEKFYKKNNIK